jgi:Cu+-exporting ATPase
VGTLEKVVLDRPNDISANIDFTIERGSLSTPASHGEPCFHCGEPCPDGTFTSSEKIFCCQGCLLVHDLLTENGLAQFYDLSAHPGVRIPRAASEAKWSYLDEPALQQQILDFTDGYTSRVTFHIPTIHCVACVWLLENLFRLHPGVGKSEVNFPRRELTVGFDPGRLALSELVALLTSIGYEPQLTLSAVEKAPVSPAWKKRWLQIGIAGFAFGNIMLFSLPAYLGMDSFSGPLFKALFGYLSLALAAPVLLYSASDYWRSAALSLRQRVLTLDVPIAVGLMALYGQSAFEIFFGRGEGYLDSLAGLVFFLLCGRVFQQKTQERIAFDRDYKCFFPLSVIRKTTGGEESIALSNLRVGDRLFIRNGEIIPADSRLVSGQGIIDYSFVTGEAEPVARGIGDYLYAGGKQLGAAIEVETVKAVSQSYLTSLWNHEAFRKERDENLDTLTNRYSRRFTRIVILVALGAVIFWFGAGAPGRALKAFASVLIVACPCALALAAPFALGTAQRLLSRVQVFLKNTLVLERMAQVDSIVFDKTGTLTEPSSSDVAFVAAQGRKEVGSKRTTVGRAVLCPPPYLEQAARTGVRDLTADEAALVYSLTRHSTHPHSIHIGESLGRKCPVKPVNGFVEVPGLGIKGTVDGHGLILGSRAWLESGGVSVTEMDLPAGSTSFLAIDNGFRGAFVLTNPLRPDAENLIRELGKEFEIALLSGDNKKERERFSHAFGGHTRMHFDQGPLNKLEFIRNLQEQGKVVMMIGDGLNDAGALKQSDIGVAVVEKVGAFSPASDVILEAQQVSCILHIIALARRSSRVVRLSFALSALYNLVGISIAAAGVLSPVICAILMPLSSVSVVLFACGMTHWAARKEGLV